MSIEVISAFLLFELAFGIDHAESELRWIDFFAFSGSHLFGNLVGLAFRDAKAAADAVHGGNLDAIFEGLVSSADGNLDVLLDHFWSIRKLIFGDEIWADGRVWADEGALVALDASGAIPFWDAVSDEMSEVLGYITKPVVSRWNVLGASSGGNWTLPLVGLFNDPTGQGLQYTLSDDFGGKITIENSVLHADLTELGENTSFILTAADSLGQSSQLSVELTPAFPEAKSDQISDPLAAGRFENDYWELPLASLFDDPAGGDLRYSVSDDLGGKVTIEDNILRVRPEGNETAAFILTAENAQGLQAQLPFDLRFPSPVAKSNGISDTVKTGLFQKGSWELRLPEFFDDPKQTSLEYSLSDDLGGAMKIEDETLQADCRGIGEADVTVTATDSLGLSAELPVKLVEQNMTWIILMIALLVLLLLIALFFLRKRAGRKH